MIMTHTLRRSKARGFTLVELLVGIVIIAVLAGLSFGISQRVKTKANLSASVQRARDLGPLLMAYTQDQNGTLPVWKDGENYWWEELVDTDLHDPEPYFRSPGHREFDPKRIEATISYGWNGSVLGREFDPGNADETGRKRMVNFKRPASVLVLADGAKEDGFGLIAPDGPLPDPERYDGKAAGMMLDGSGRVFDIKEELGADSRWFEEAI